MRAAPMMPVDVAGRTELRPGVLDVLLYDCTGKPTVSRLRPQLNPGEVLRDRLGTFPTIIREVA